MSPVLKFPRTTPSMLSIGIILKAIRSLRYSAAGEHRKLMSP